MKLTDIKNSLNEISAIGGLKQVVKGNTDRVEGIKLSKEMAQAMIDWFNSSPYGRKYPKAAKGRLHLSLGIMSSMGLDRYAKHKGAKKELQYIKDLAKAMRDNVNEAKFMDKNKKFKVYDKLKKGDKIRIKFGNSIRKDNEAVLVVTKGKTKVGKAQVERIILKNPANPSGVKYYLYNRDGNVSLAKGDMAAVIVDMIPESINEAKYDIGMARKGNGLTIYNKAEEEKGDYKNVAHIDNKGKIKYYDKKVPSKIKKQIEAEAKKMMEIKIEGTMKLTELLNEDVYVKNKETGNVYQVKKANPAKHEPPSKGEMEKAKADDAGSKEEPKTDSPEAKAEQRKNLVDGNFDDNTTGQDHADMLAKNINMMGGEEAEKAIKHLLDKNDFSETDELKSIKSNLERMSYRAGMFERKLNKAEDSGDEDASMEFSDKLNDELAELGEMLERVVENDDFSMANEEEYGEKNESVKESKGNTMKLKNLLKESFESGRVYSNPFHTPFVKENEMDRDKESNEMTNEQKMAFLESVKGYKTFGEAIYRKEGLTKVYESIRNLVELAGKNMVKETEGSFDGITVGRHVKRMNESFKVFEKTLREVGTLQQRLESTYDEIGEVLGKYYEINELEEGNEFGAARAKAIANGDSEFEVDGKKYKVTGVDKKDKENAKKFANESKSMKLTSMLNESFGFGELPSEKLMKMKVSAKDMLDSVNELKIEADIEVDDETEFKVDLKHLLDKHKVEEDKVDEGFSTEEKRIVLLAVRKLMKYKNIDINLAAQYVVGAAEELKMDIDKGRVKK